MVDHIGIVACSAEGAALCYRTICIEGAQLLGAHAHPEVSIHSHSLAEYVKCLDRNDWQGVGELMLSSANKLAQIGADFLICRGQYHPPSAALCAVEITIALVAHCRGGRGNGRRAGFQIPRFDWNSLARRQQCLSRKA